MFPKFEQIPQESLPENEKYNARAIDSAPVVDHVQHTPEELEKACAEYQTHLERMSPYFKVFTGMLAVPFEFTTKVPTAAFDHHTGKMLLGVKWFVENNLSPTQASWTCLHELSHCTDCESDPKRYKETSKEDCVRGAIRIGSHAEKSYKRMFGEEMPQSMRENIEKEAKYGIFRFFYNATDDVWVNSNVSYKASMYSRDLPAGREITSLYRDVLFPKADLSGENKQAGKTPRHMQFGHAILRREMVRDEDSLVSDDVREALERKIRFNKRLQTSQEIINNYIKPGAGRDVSIGRRRDVLEETLLPVFEELYKKDIDELLARMKEEEKEEQETGEGQGHGQQGEKGENSPGESKENGGGQSGDKSEKEQDKKNTGKGASGEEDKDEVEGGETPKEEDKESESKEGQKGGASGEEKEGEGKEESKGESDAGKDSKEKGGETKEGGNGGGGEQGDESQKPAQEQKSKVPRGGNFFKNYHEEAEKQTPDIIDVKDIEEWYKQAKEELEKKEAEQNTQRKETEEKSQVERDKEWCKQNKIEFSPYSEYKKIEMSVAQPREELARLWRHIAFGESLGTERAMTPGSKVGANVHIPSAIRAFPDIIAGDFENVRVMERVKHTEKKIDKPERIEISILLDRSGSMHGKGNIKTDVATQVVVLLLSSLEDFNGYLASARGRTKSALHADAEVIAFGDDARCIKSFRSDRGSVDEKREVVKMMGGIYDNYYNNNDHMALAQVNQSISMDKEAQIRKGKLMKIVFEITDGVPDRPMQMVEEIEQLDRRGVIVRAFQIGGNLVEQKQFSNVWNRGSNQYGSIVGENVKNLIPALTAALREHLGDIEM